MNALNELFRTLLNLPPQATELAKGQSIAVIYAEADKEYVLLNAVMKPVEKK